MNSTQTAHVQTVKNIRELTISLSDLYDNKKQINIHLSDKPYVFHVLLMRNGVADCKISSFAANLWTRTKAGVEKRKYRRIQDLQTAIKKQIHNRVETKGESTFSLSDDIYTF